MTTGLFTHLDCWAHDTTSRHPERIARLDVLKAALAAPQFGALKVLEPAPASVDQLLRAHSPEHVDHVAATVRMAGDDGHMFIDADTVVSGKSYAAALRAAGAVCAAVDAVLAGDIANGFCAVRPPGHHAERDQAMGFCLFNNIAIGGLHALEQPGIGRIAIVDFDVHHGNGTQAIFEADPRCLYISTHQFPHYPGTGAETEVGVGNILNVPMDAGSGSEAIRAAFTETVLPRLVSFAPDMLFISAGFDAHRADPLAQQNFETEDYRWITKQLCEAAAHLCAGRVVSALEGGYDLEALADSVAAHVEVLMHYSASGENQLKRSGASHE